MPARACGRARDASCSGGHGSVVCMQDGACAMGRARCKGSQWDRRCDEQHWFFTCRLAVGGCTRDCFGSCFGARAFHEFFFSFFIRRCSRPKTAFLTKKIGSRFARSISGRRTKGIFVTRFLFEGLGSQKRGFGADFRPCQK